MGRYTYNSSVVSNAISELNDAMNSVANVTTEIQAGINTITNANGARAIDIDFSALLKLQQMAEEVIDEDIRTIQSKVQVIEDYENAPWYTKLFSSIGMGLSKFVEGIASGIENITDGAVSIVGFVGGIFNSDFKNSVAEYVAKDHVGDWFQDKYDNGFLSGVSKYSYFSENSTAANIFKGFGTAAPYIALSFVGGGVGMYTEMAAAALGGIGSGTEAGINKALMNDPNLSAGDAFNSAFGQGVWQGTKNAAMVYVMHKISQTAKTNIDGRRNAQTPGGYKATGTGSIGKTTAANNRAIKEVSEEFAETALGKGLAASDDVLGKGVTAVKNGATKVASKLPGASKASELFNKVASSNIVQNIAKTTTVAVARHPSLATAVAGAVFTADQVDEDVINSEYRIQQRQLQVTTRPPVTTTPPQSTTTPPVATTTPPPTTTTPLPATTTPLPATTTPGGTTPGPTTPGPTTPRPTNTGYNPTPTPTVSSSTPTPSVTGTTIDPTSNTPTPTPTGTTYNPTPTYTSTSYNPTYTPTSGGGGYSDEGYTGEGTEGEFDIPETEDVSGSLSDIVGGNKYTNIPTSAAPITTTTTTAGKKSIIPVIAGLGAATVAGLGTKAYLDKKEESTSEEDFEADEWIEEDSVNVDYEEAMSEDSDYLSPADEIAYQDGEEASYEAVNSSELASMQ